MASQYRPSPIEVPLLQSALLQRLQNLLAHDAGSHDIDQQNPCLQIGAGRQAAVLLALTDEENPRLLLIRRSLQLTLHPGEIALPGGKCDRQDVDLRATALREAWEEVALPSESVRYAGVLAPRVSMSALSVTPIVGVIPPDLELRAHAGEVADILYAPLAYFADRTHLRADRILRNGAARCTARFQFAHYTIWGITASFIVELVNRLYAADLNIELRAQRALLGDH